MNFFRVYFYKRAQLLIADIVQAFNGHEFGRFYDSIHVMN
ncbi:hypothetical protein J4471_05935 [Candidatus Woesearchaeota archaeon]|nr:hypothetical protein [Candidatus Woesearchaeota archaeon]